MYVSILTRPEGRVQRHDGHIAKLCQCFNPHPSRRTGATTIEQLADQVRVVSILTRPEGRVQP